MRSRTALAQVLLGCLLWGTTGTAATLGALDAPAAVGSARLLGGSAALAVLLAARGRAGELRAVLAPGRRGRVVLAGLAAGGYQIAFFSAVATTGVTLGTVVALGVAPVATGICARLLLGEALSRRWAGATALAVAGCTVMVLAAGGGGGTASTAGVALAVAAGACYGLYTTAAKALLDDGLAPLPVLTATLGLGAVLTAPVLLAGGSALLVPAAVPVLTWLCLAATAAAYTSFAAGLRSLRASTMGTLSLAEPLLATVLGLAVLAERPAPLALAGAGALLAGLVLVAAPGPARARSPVVALDHGGARRRVERLPTHPVSTYLISLLSGRSARPRLCSRLARTLRRPPPDRGAPP